LTGLCPIRLEIDPLEQSPLPVDLALVKTYCAVDGSDFDDILESSLLAAVKMFEDTTHRTLFRRVHRWVLADFPQTAYQPIELPRGKTREVHSIAYVAGGQTMTLTGPSSIPAGTGYQEDLRGDSGGVVMPPRGGSWPSPDRDCPAPVVITFEAGWSSAELPKDVLLALLFATRIALDDNRGAVDPIKLAANRETFEAMVSGYRLTRWY
jgi:uncharacterized phiE125 gp8 family phage protein